MEVDAYLMSPTGVEVTKNEGGFCRGVGGECFVICDGGLAAGGIDDGHFLAIHWVAADVGEDGFTVGLWDAIGDGEVKLLHGGALGKLGDESLVGWISFRDNKAAGGIFIEAMDDTGAFDTADARELAVAVVEKGVDESAIVVAGGWMDDHTVGFMEDDDVLVLKKDVERDILRGGDVRDGLWNDYGYSISGFHAVPWLGGLVVDEDVLLANERLDAGAGKIRDF